jgi:hypothetical protein
MRIGTAGVWNHHMLCIPEEATPVGQSAIFFCRSNVAAACASIQLHQTDNTLPVEADFGQKSRWYRIGFCRFQASYNGK